MRKRKLSLAALLMLTMSLLVVGMVGLNLFINHVVLEKYYSYEKEKELLEGYELIYAASSNGTLETEEFDIPFERITSTGNISILIADSRTLHPVRVSTSDADFFTRELSRMITNRSDESVVIEKTSENYVLARLSDSRMNEDFLILSGTLAGGEYIYMRTAIESIHEITSITNRFLTVIGIGTLFLSLLVIFFVSRSISGPIREMTTISQRMAGLEFDARYIPRGLRGAEIDELGHNMNEMSQTLEETISELKTANLQLQQDIQDREQLDEMRKDFVSNVSHELKTPIALIQGYAEGLQDCINDDPESRDYYCEVILDEADKMNRMVKQLLTLNHLEFGQERVEMERFNLTELCRGVVNANLRLAARDDITVYFDDAAEHYAWGDAFKVEEVITNYLSNAIHYAAGDKQIRVRIEERDKLLRLSVFNTGSQISDEDQERIWEKFYKVDKARTREYGGSGIGLSIVKAIMDSFHREYGVVNHEDGVEFWFELEKA